MPSTEMLREETTPQTFYAVLDEDGAYWAGPYDNAHEAESVAKLEAGNWSEPFRVIQYTVIATFGGTDE